MFERLRERLLNGKTREELLNCRLDALLYKLTQPEVKRDLIETNKTLEEINKTLIELEKITGKKYEKSKKDVDRILQETEKHTSAILGELTKDISDSEAEDYLAQIMREQRKK